MNAVYWTQLAIKVSVLVDIQKCLHKLYTPSPRLTARLSSAGGNEIFFSNLANWLGVSST